MIEAIEKLTEGLAALPGIGRKSAQRLAFHIVSMEKEDVRQLAIAMYDAKKRVTFCERCGNLKDIDEPLCEVCANPRRDSSVICVVTNLRELYAIERIHEFNGVYHVLGGTISPVDGRNPEDLNILSLMERVKAGGVQELLMALSPDMEGEATALYIANLAKPYGVRITRIAHGVPIGGELEYTDDVTLSRAIAGRRDIFDD